MTEIIAIFQACPPSGSSAPEAINIVNGSTYTVPVGRRLLGIDFYRSVSPRTFSIGTTPGGTDIADSEEIPANSSFTFDRSYFFEDGGTLHFSGIIAIVKIHIL